MKLAPALLPLVVAVALTGCGAESSSPTGPSAPADDGLADIDPLPPQGSPPGDVGEEGPPPAWVETAGGSFWLAWATYCWGGLCADSVAPSCGEPYVPDVEVIEGETVTFYLELDPTGPVSLSFFDDVTEGEGGPDGVELGPGELTWTVDRGGPVWLSTRADEGDVSYAACLRLDEPGGGGGSGALTVPQALARGDGPATVTGTIYAEGDEVRLCDALAESYPPQCPGGFVRLEGFKLASVAGLTREGEIAWGSGLTTVRGTLRGSTLVVSG